MQLSPHRYLTPTQLADRWQCDIVKVWRWLRVGRLPGTRLGHVWLIDLADVLEIERVGGLLRRDAISPVSLRGNSL